MTPNRLINEQSPYLLQHAHNPVDWYPWGEEAFKKAQEEHKPVIVSIGYAACHWCHVMERESFENEEVAAFMNRHFVCIKVDREEHPDVDHFYMDAIQALSGSGGWPLNAFVTPEKVPFYGGTYYPPRPAFNRPSWMQLLHRIVELWHQQHDEVMQQAGQMTEHLQQASQRTLRQVEGEVTLDTCRAIADNLLQQADKEKGGFGNAPKFPGTMAITCLLEHYHFTGYKPALDHALKSLDSMIEGGIYDQLGGGFARYATDREWLIPHFEKMLYDNALIVSALCDAYSLTKDERYRRVVGETIGFVERELKDASGGYYCALDADSEGVEGKFYTWTWDEWCTVLGGPEEAVAAHLGVSMHGNWEETNILNIAMPLQEASREYGLSVDELEGRVVTVKSRLLAARQGRIRPLTDDKCLLAWNALMNTALSKAAVVFEEQAWLTRAGEHMEWMLQTFRSAHGYLHTWKQGKARIPAKLDDLAYLGQAMLQLGQATGAAGYTLQAGELAQLVIDEFSREDGFFYYTSTNHTDIPVRKVDVYDGAQPSANAVMAGNLQLCGMCLERADWLERSANMVQQMSENARRYAYSFGHWATLLQRKVKGLKTVVCGGPEAATAAADMRMRYMPQAYVAEQRKSVPLLPVAEKKFFEGELYIFVCSEHACLPPVANTNEAFRLVNQ